MSVLARCSIAVRSASDIVTPFAIDGPVRGCVVQLGRAERAPEAGGARRAPAPWRLARRSNPAARPGPNCNARPKQKTTESVRISLIVERGTSEREERPAVALRGRAVARGGSLRTPSAYGHMAS